MTGDAQIPVTEPEADPMPARSRSRGRGRSLALFVVGLVVAVGATALLVVGFLAYTLAKDDLTAAERDESLVLPAVERMLVQLDRALQLESSYTGVLDESIAIDTRFLDLMAALPDLDEAQAQELDQNYRDTLRLEDKALEVADEDLEIWGNIDAELAELDEELSATD